MTETAGSSVLWGGVPASRRLRRLVAASFDGNHSDSLYSWIVPDPPETFIGVTPLALSQLTEITVEGDLGWLVLVPQGGYRL